MLKIRLQRVGKRHDPSFRVVLVDSRRGPKSGNFLEILGNYNAQKGEPAFKGERIKELMGKGAQVSDTVYNLLIDAKVLDGKKKDVLKHTRIEKKVAKKKSAEGGGEEGGAAEAPKPKEESGDEQVVGETPKEVVAEEKDEEPVPAPAEEKEEVKEEEKPAEEPTESEEKKD